MIPSASHSAQRGATLIVGLIMLALITLMVATSFTLSTTNLKSVGNMQFRDETIAAATRAIEVSYDLANMPAGDRVGAVGTSISVPVDIDNNTVADYTVSVSRTCQQAAAIVTPASSGSGSSVSLGFAQATNDYLVLWDYDAIINDTATGAAVRVRQGVRQRLTQVECDMLCPPAPGAACS